MTRIVKEQLIFFTLRHVYTTVYVYSQKQKFMLVVSDKLNVFPSNYLCFQNAKPEHLLSSVNPDVLISRFFNCFCNPKPNGNRFLGDFQTLWSYTATFHMDMDLRTHLYLQKWEPTLLWTPLPHQFMSRFFVWTRNRLRINLDLITAT